MFPACHLLGIPDDLVWTGSDDRVPAVKGRCWRQGSHPGRQVLNVVTSALDLMAHPASNPTQEVFSLGALPVQAMAEHCCRAGVQGAVDGEMLLPLGNDALCCIGWR